MAGKDNLIPQNKRTKSEQREIAIKGGKASGKARREKKNMQQMAEMLLNMEVSKSQQSTKAMMKQLGIKDEDMTYSMSILVSMLAKASGGDVRAAQFLRDTMDDVNKMRYSNREAEEPKGDNLADTIEAAYKKRMKEQEKNGKNK